MFLQFKMNGYTLRNSNSTIFILPALSIGAYLSGNNLPLFLSYKSIRVDPFLDGFLTQEQEVTKFVSL